MQVEDRSKCIASSEARMFVHMSSRGRKLIESKHPFAHTCAHVQTSIGCDRKYLSSRVQTFHKLASEGGNVRFSKYESEKVDSAKLGVREDSRASKDVSAISV